MLQTFTAGERFVLSLNLNIASTYSSRDDWGVIFTLLEVVGAGASPAMPGQVLLLNSA